MTPSLPAEILEEIISNVKNKEDLENCLLVCRSWNHVADRCRFNNGGIQVILNGNNSSLFLQDLGCFPNFGPKVKVLMFNDGDTSASQAIINMCTNLTGLRCSPKFLGILNSSVTKLPNIQKLDTGSVFNNGLQLKQLNLLLKLCSTLKVLDLPKLEDMQCEFEDQGGMYEFISRFTNLESLSIYGSYYDELPLNIDLPLLLKSSPKLKQLTVLLKCGFITSTSAEEIASVDPNRSIENIVIRYDCIDLNTIEFIMQKLKNVKRLDLLPDDKEDARKLTILEGEPKEVFYRFTRYCKCIERANVFVECATAAGLSTTLGNI